MKRPLVAVSLLTLLATPALAQTFEAADVHPSAPDATTSGALLPGGRLEFRATTLLRLISFAWNIPPDRIAGGPSWLDTAQFDVLAKSPASAGRAEQLVMLQNLLGERFDLAVKSEEKPVPVFALVNGKGRTPKESAADTEPGCKRSTEGGATLTCRHTTMDSLAETLPMVAPGYFTRTVVNRTDLKGAYDFQLHWVARGKLPAGAEGLHQSDSLFSSIEKELGVRVESQTAPLAILTVVHANRVPAPNPPDVTEKLGPSVKEFDVAEVRPSGPGEKEDFNLENGRIKATAIALKDLIEFAYNLEDDQLKNAPKWVESEKFDIVAKTAPTASVDTLRTLLRALLVERFALEVHEDTQPVTVYALTAVKPKLHEADPAGRSTCTMSMEDGKRAYTCTNVTMAQFADKLRAVATGYLDRQAVDLTGLKGSYDFTVTWSPIGRTLGIKGAPTTPGESAAPSGELTLFEAISRQLGLKLAMQKHPMPVIVIDQLNRTPTEN